MRKLSGRILLIWWYPALICKNYEEYLVQSCNDYCESRRFEYHQALTLKILNIQNFVAKNLKPQWWWCEYLLHPNYLRIENHGSIWNLWTHKAINYAKWNRRWWRTMMVLFVLLRLSPLKLSKRGLPPIYHHIARGKRSWTVVETPLKRLRHLFDTGPICRWDNDKRAAEHETM